MDIIEKISAITKMASGIEDHEIYDKLGDLRIEAFELKMKYLELKEENRMLKDKLKEETQKEYKDSCYYFDSNGPYCTRCYDVDNKKVIMQFTDNGWSKKMNVCPECKNTVVVENTR